MLSPGVPRSVNTVLVLVSNIFHSSTPSKLPFDWFLYTLSHFVKVPVLMKAKNTHLNEKHLVLQNRRLLPLVFPSHSTFYGSF